MTDKLKKVEDGDFFTLDEILAADDTLYETVTVPEWGGKKVMLKSLTAAEVNAWNGENVKARNNDAVANLENISARLLMRSIVDPNTKKRMFNARQVETLGAKNARVLERLVKVARRLSGIGDDEMEAAVDEHAENFPDGQSENSTTD